MSQEKVTRYKEEKANRKEIYDEDIVNKKREYRKHYKRFFEQDDFIISQQSILVLYKPILPEFRHYFCFSEGFYIRGISNLTPIPKSKKKDGFHETIFFFYILVSTGFA